MNPKEKTAGAAHVAKSRLKKREDIASVLLRKETALANLRELEEAQQRGKLIPIDEFRPRLFAAGQTVTSGMLAIPDRLAQKLAAITDHRQIRQILDEEVRIVLNTLEHAIRTIENSSAA